MQKRLLFFIFLFITIHVNAQDQAASTISELLLKHVNNLRDSIGLQPLQLDNALRKAGEDQAFYISERGKLTHFQKTFLKETPSERIQFYGANRTYSGENIATVNVVWFKKAVLDKEAVAKAFFDAWYHSPPHYKNMISPNFTKMGLGIRIKENQVYGAQVFSSDEITLPRAFKSANLAWGVRPGEVTCKDDAQVYETMFFANSIEIDGTDIYFYFHDLDFFRKVIRNENDGLAIDVVLREQLPCGKENQFHISSVYDGEMQQPVYKYDLFKNNHSSNPRKIRVKIGTVPPYLANKQWAANVIVINNNILCDYSVPASVPSSIYPLLKIDPYFELNTISGTEKTVRVVDTLQSTLSFDRSQVNFSDMERLNGRFYGWYKYVKDWEVNCYASVEGAEWFNKRLLKDRRQKVANFMYQNFEDSSSISWKLAENWEMMNQQIQDHAIQALKGKSKQQIRYYLKKNHSGLFDSLLYEQRKTKITAYFDTLIKVNSYESFLIAEHYDTNLVFGDLNWNGILYHEYIANKRGIHSLLFDSLYQHDELKTNLLGAGAIKYRNGQFDSTHVEQFLMEVDESNSKQLFNYAHFLTTYWFSRYSRSSEIRGTAVTISPQKLREKLENIDTAIISHYDLDRLLINNYLAGIHYYVTQGDWTFVNDYFEAIAAMVKADRFDANEAVGLALFCNHFHKFQQSIEILKPFYERDELDENGLFILARTATLWRSNLDLEFYHAVMKSAKEKNALRYCNWLDNEFQIQRDEYIKNDFCNSCQ
jgi:uncharacterized protein YkwD